MGFRSWSKAIRELDWNVNWSVAVGKNNDSGNGAINVYIRHEPTSGTPTEIKIVDNGVVTARDIHESLFYEQFESGDSNSLINGEIIRGLDSIVAPTDATDTTQKFKLVVENASALPLTVFDGHVSIRKMYPGESITPAESDDHGLTGSELTDLQGRYTELNTDPKFEGFVYSAQTFIDSDPFPANLTALFNGLSSASTESELQAVLSSTEYQTYYSTSFPKRPFPATMVGKVDGTDTAYPVVLSNTGDRVEFDFTGSVISYYFNKLAFD